MPSFEQRKKHFLQQVSSLAQGGEPDVIHKNARERAIWAIECSSDESRALDHYLQQAHKNGSLHDMAAFIEICLQRRDVSTYEQLNGLRGYLGDVFARLAEGRRRSNEDAVRIYAEGDPFYDDFGFVYPIPDYEREKYLRREASRLQRPLIPEGENRLQLL